jgi:hypothetical protein
VSDWQDIETVPRGRRILLGRHKPNPGVWTGKIGRAVDLAALRKMTPAVAATHWQECPDPPLKQKGRKR